MRVKRVRRATSVLALLLVVAPTWTFDAHKFKTCAQSTFCKDLRPGAPKPHTLSLHSLQLDDGVVSATIRVGVDSAATDASPTLQLLLEPLVPQADALAPPPWRVRVRGDANRFEVAAELDLEGLRTRARAVRADDANHTDDAATAHGFRAEGAHMWSHVEVVASPLELRLFAGALGEPRDDERPLAVVNGRGLLRFAAAEPEAPWRSRCDHLRDAFDGKVADSRVHGCAAIAADVSFPSAVAAFGLPGRASSLALATTMDGAYRSRGEPYRLFNLDVFKYGRDTHTGLYGSIPFLLAHGGGHSRADSAAVLWLNAADTYVDLLAGGGKGSGITSHWLSEGGALDLVLLPGPSDEAALAQLAHLTGRPPLPPLWSMGYHQSHWNVRSQTQVLGIDAGADRSGCPLDAVWLDVEHTDAKRYFTWNSNFPSPDAMAAALSHKGRRLVGIADPHLLADALYPLYADALAEGLLVRTAGAGGTPFEGECWPGRSSYVDFLQPAAREWWGALYGGCPSGRNCSRWSALPDGVQPRWPAWLHAWNDMNEPSVFDGQEVSMAKDALHRTEVGCGAGGGGCDVEHRLVHNAYGALQLSATFSGLRRRLGGKQRPFVLSRAFFVGSQRWGAVWTGDNSASWDHLRLGNSMVLALSVAGLPFTGADVGGFFGQPSAELLVRWYQSASFHAFFRSHAHIDSPRREPWLLQPPEAARLVIESICERQRLLPYWSTLWWAAAHDSASAGLPLVRPLWLGAATSDAGETRALLAEESAWTVGADLLVRPVVEPNARSVRLLLPRGPSFDAPPHLWYSLLSGAVLQGGAWHTEQVRSLSDVPRWQRGGSILPRRERVRRSALLARWDPLTLHVAPAADGAASGLLFLDDGQTDALESGGAVVLRFSFACAKEACYFSSAPEATAGEGSEFAPPAPIVVERILLRNASWPPHGAGVSLLLINGANDSSEREVEVAQTPYGVELRRLRAPALEYWTIRVPREPLPNVAAASVLPLHNGKSDECSASESGSAEASTGGQCAGLPM